MAKGDVGDAAGDAVGDVARRADNDAELVVGQGGQLGGETVDCPTVADAALALELGDHEAQPEAALVVLLGKLNLIHLVERLALEELLAVSSFAAGEEELEQLGLIVGGGIKAAGRRHA